MDERPSRRAFLAASVTTASVGFAGCSGSTSSDPEGSNQDDGPDATSSAPGAWPTRHRTNGRSGYTPASGPREGVAEQWRFEGEERILGAPVIADGVAYVQDDSTLHAVSLESGESTWSTSVGHSAEGVTVSDGELIVAGSELSALDAGSGEEQWSVPLDGNRAREATVADVPLEDDGATRTILAARADSDLVAFRASDQSELWTFSTTGYVYSAPSYADGTAFVASSRHLYAVDAATGTEEWHVEMDDRTGGTPTVVDGTVYAGDESGSVIAVDAASGERDWKTTVPDDVYSSVAVGNGRVYATTWGEQLHAIDAEDGDVDWTFDTDGLVRAAPAVAGETVYVASDDRHVYAVDATDGTFLWRFETEGLARATPAIVDGTVYVGDHSGRFYALGAGSTTGANPNDLDELTVDQSWPSRQYDAGNSGSVPWSGPTADVDERWDAMLHGDCAAPLVDRGSVLTIADGTLHAFDGATGEPEWTFEHEDLSAPIALGDSAIVTAAGHDVHAFDLSERSHRWSTEVAEIVGNPVVAGDRLLVAHSPYLANDEGTLGALALGDGSIEWEFDLGSSPETSPAVDGETAYLWTEDGLVAVDLQSRTERWTASAGSPPNTAPTITDDAIYVSDDDGSLHRLAPEDGSEVWNVDARTDYWTYVAATADAVVYVAGGTIVGLDAENGEERWTYTTEEQGTSTRPIVGDGVVYGTTGDYAMHAIDLETGERLWKDSPGGFDSFKTPAIVDGLLVTAYGNQLLAYQEPDR